MAPITDFSWDYKSFLLPWVGHYKNNGIIEGLRQGVGNYYIPYNLFLAIIAQLPGEPWIYITLLSGLCDYIMAYYVYRLALLLTNAERLGGWSYQKAVFAGIVTLYLPAVIFDSALWKQCDSIYTCFVIISLYYVLREKYGRSLFWLGCGAMFKLQALFIAPFFVILYIFRKKGLRFWCFFWIPICYILGGMPAILAGRRASEVLLIYFHQYRSSYLSANYPNFYYLIMQDPSEPARAVVATFYHPALLGTLAAFVFFTWASMKFKETVNKADLVYLGLWCVWTCAMFLPAMHERFAYPAVILLTMYVLACDFRKFGVALGLNIITAISFSNFLLQMGSVSFVTLAFFNMLIYLYATYDLYRTLQTP
jgi:Gpi18-like mannosyltransferase